MKRELSRFTVNGMKVIIKVNQCDHYIENRFICLQILKLYAWEPSFEKQVLDIRDNELKVLRKATYLTAYSTFVWQCAPFLVAVASFAVYVLSDSSHVLLPETAFVSLSLFNIMRFPMQTLPMMFTQLVQVRKS